MAELVDAVLLKEVASGVHTVWMCAFKSRLPHKLINMIEIKDGKLFIDGVLATAVILVDNRVVKGPFHSKDDVQHKGFLRPETTYNKNIITPGSTIVCGGDFKLGDG